MSLREDYSGDCTGGFHDDMATVFQAGVDFVGTMAVPGTAYSALSTALSNAAAAGTKVFTVTVETSFEVNNLRLNGVHQQSHFAGIRSALAAEGIYDFYVGLSLNTSQTTTTSIDFNFSL